MRNPKPSIVLATVLLLASAVFGQHGKTIFGENKKTTLKAMKMVSKALGVKCLHCHVREDGKILYPKDTAEKEIARSMKMVFVDSLFLKRQTLVTLEEDKKKTHITARFVAKGDSAGIHLTAKTADGEVYRKLLPLPTDPKALYCATCHNGKLRFLTRAH